MFASAWLAFYGLLLSVAGVLLSWYFYTAAMPMCLILVSIVFDGLALLRPFRWRFLITAPVWLFAVIEVALPIGSSPVIRDYPGWRIAGRLSQSVCGSHSEIASELPDDTGIVLINVPSHYRESAANSLGSRSAAIFWPRSISAWLTANSVENTVVVLGSSQHSGTFRQPTVELKSPDKLCAFRVYMFDGVRFVPHSLAQQDETAREHR